MGVFRLNGLMNLLGAVEDINLKDAANDWRVKGGQPTVVLDCLNVARKFYDPNSVGGSDVLCNGEYKKIAETMKTFIRAFKDISIELVFFLDGPVDKTKLESWMERRDTRLQKYSDTVSRIEFTPLSSLPGDAFPCMILPVMKEVMKEENITIIRGVDDHDKEMAKYVVDNNCLGILSDDTDFVVFDDIPNIFSNRMLNIQNMTTQAYCRQKFLSEIKLSPEAMPIFATLLGNDYVKREEAKRYSKRKFHSTFLNGDTVQILVKVANRIYADSRNMEETAERLAKEIGLDSKVMLDSLRSYDLKVGASSNVDNPTGNSPWDSVVELCLQRFKDGYIENQTLSIVKRQLCTQSEKLEDPLYSHVDILQGLRQRIYSILLHEKPSCREVTEILAGGIGSMKRCPVPLLKVEVEHPGIAKLWDPEEDINDKRWALFWWAVRSHRHGETLIPFDALSELKSLSDHLLLVGLALLYLDKVVEKLSEQERVVLMVMATSIPYMNVAQLSENCVLLTKKRAVNLATLYMQTYAYVRWVMDVCGLQLAAKSRDAYSGQLFHYLFQSNDPEIFFEVSGNEARKNYDDLQKALDKAREKIIGTRQPAPTKNPFSPNKDGQPKQGEVEDNRRVEGRMDDNRREERRTDDNRREERRTDDSRREEGRTDDNRREERRTDDNRREERRTDYNRRNGRRMEDCRRVRDSSEERRDCGRRAHHENARQSRQDNFNERRHLGWGRRGNYSRGSDSRSGQIQRPGRFGRQQQSYRNWGSDRPRRPQNQRRNHRGYSNYRS